MDASGTEGGEFAALDRLRAMLAEPPPSETWIGDDAAVVAAPQGPLLLAADSLVEGIHTDFAIAGIDDFGWKAVSVNVSDIAAMGGRPLHLLVTVAGPSDTDLEHLYTGIKAAADEYGCAVVGGDFTNAPTLVVTVAVTGEGQAPVLRSGAQPGDAIFVTGPLGSSAAGLALLRSGHNGPSALVDAYRRPRARVHEGNAAKAAGATAMIDVSDGFIADLGHIARSSGVGFMLDEVPVADGANVEQALTGGEDYQLVFTAPDAPDVVAAFVRAGCPGPICVGTVVADESLHTLKGTPVSERGGWEHQWR